MGNDHVTFGELRRLGRILQDAFNDSDVDVVVIDYELREAIKEFDKYFEFVRLNNTPYVKCRRGIGAYNLKRRFIDWLLPDTREVVMRVMKG